MSDLVKHGWSTGGAVSLFFLGFLAVFMGMAVLNLCVSVQRFSLPIINPTFSVALAICSNTKFCFSTGIFARGVRCCNVTTVWPARWDFLGLMIPAARLSNLFVLWQVAKQNAFFWWSGLRKWVGHLVNLKITQLTGGDLAFCVSKPTITRSKLSNHRLR